jgi:adenine deaminase
LDHLIGGIAPGRYADMLIIPDLNTITPEYVISNGKIIVQKEQRLVSPRKHLFSENSRRSVYLPKYLTSEDFFIPVPDEVGQLDVRVIDMVTDLVTKEIIRSLLVTDAQIKADPVQDILKIAAIERADDSGKRFIGLIRGFQMRSGAIASSAAWDTSDIIVVGTNDADMAMAVNRIRDLQGGAVLCNQGKILSEIPLPVLGLISDMPMETLVQRIEEFRIESEEVGIPFSDPLLTLVALTGAAIPFLRICEEGLVRLKDGKCLGLFANPAEQ